MRVSTTTLRAVATWILFLAFLQQSMPISLSRLTRAHRQKEPPPLKMPSPPPVPPPTSRSPTPNPSASPSVFFPSLPDVPSTVKPNIRRPSALPPTTPVPPPTFLLVSRDQPSLPPTAVAAAETDQDSIPIALSPTSDSTGAPSPGTTMSPVTGFPPATTVESQGRFHQDFLVVFESKSGRNSSFFSAEQQRHIQNLFEGYTEVFAPGSSYTVKSKCKIFNQVALSGELHILSVEYDMTYVSQRTRVTGYQEMFLKFMNSNIDAVAKDLRLSPLAEEVTIQILGPAELLLTSELLLPPSMKTIPADSSLVADGEKENQPSSYRSPKLHQDEEESKPKISAVLPLTTHTSILVFACFPGLLLLLLAAIVGYFQYRRDRWIQSQCEFASNLGERYKRKGGPLFNKKNKKYRKL